MRFQSEFTIGARIECILVFTVKMLDELLWRYGYYFAQCLIIDIVQDCTGGDFYARFDARNLANYIGEVSCIGMKFSQSIHYFFI